MLSDDHQHLDYDLAEHRLLIVGKRWDRGKSLIVFDELHKMNDWKSWLKGIYDVEGIPPRLLVTGSAKLDAFRKTGDSLAGRHFQFMLHPLDVKEAADNTDLEPDEIFRRLMTVGGFPEPFLDGGEGYYNRWKRSHIDLILKEDLLTLTAVRDIQMIETLIEMLRSRVGSPVSVNSLARDLQKSPNTIQNWMRLLADLYVVFAVPPYHRNIARALLKQPKYYFYDNGMVIGGRQRETGESGRLLAPEGSPSLGGRRGRAAWHLLHPRQGGAGGRLRRHKESGAAASHRSEVGGYGPERESPAIPEGRASQANATRRGNGGSRVLSDRGTGRSGPPVLARPAAFGDTDQGDSGTRLNAAIRGEGCRREQVALQTQARIPTGLSHSRSLIPVRGFGPDGQRGESTPFPPSVTKYNPPLASRTSHMIFTGWTTPLQLLRLELIQRDYEGHPVPDVLREQVAALDDEEDAMNFGVVDAIYKSLDKLPRDPKFGYVQPNELEVIRRERPDGPRQLGGLDETDLLDKFHGAWTGRAVGCALGKPVEGMGIRGQRGMRGRKAIRTYLENRRDWPLDYYFSGMDAGDDLRIGCPLSQRENIAFMEPDDDIHYTLVALRVLEDHGPGFRWRDVAGVWNRSLPYSAICTAEAQAIMNYNNAVPKIAPSDWVTPEYTSTNRNPYREWIGAQIRADGWGYACAGNPELAAEFAFRDACWTHRANGIYGEMMFAAITAAAFVVSDPIELVNIGLSEIPQRCRLAEACRAALAQVPDCEDFHDYMDWVEEHYGDLSGVHTVNNALVVIGSMIFGGMDFHQSVCRSVEGGWDTDCNGATCGSIVGAASGVSALNSSLVAPLNDTIRPSVIGFQEISMTELAERTLQVHQTVVANA